MSAADATCWTLVGAAATGDTGARDRFARLYQPVARACFAARWQHSPLRAHADDAVQDTFVECFKPAGALSAAVAAQPVSFRAFFFGVVRNVARRYEERQRPVAPLPSDCADDETGLAEAFDRAWALALLREAARVQAETAATAGPRAERRVELLRLRFQDGLPIREIAARWNEDAAHLHREYATARDEFRAALTAVMVFHLPTATGTELDAACRDLLALMR